MNDKLPGGSSIEFEIHLDPVQHLQQMLCWEWFVIRIDLIRDLIAGFLGSPKSRQTVNELSTFI